MRGKILVLLNWSKSHIFGPLDHFNSDVLLVGVDYLACLVQEDLFGFIPHCFQKAHDA